MSTEAKTGPRPLTESELEAVTMRLLKEPLEAISARTGLSPARIAAAVDHTRVLARVGAAQAQQAPPAPARVPVARRPAPVRRNALASQPPPPWRPGYIAGSGELTDRLAAAPPVDETVVSPANPTPEPAAPVVLEPGTDTWNRLAESPAVRAWAAADGWHIPAGRLPGAIVIAYHNAHGGTP